MALLLVAELMRNTGKFTMADVLSFRLKERPSAWPPPSRPSPCASSTCSRRWRVPGTGFAAVGITERVGQSIVVAVVGILMIVYVLIAE